MGNYSWLRKMMNAPERCLINWEKADTSKLFKHWLMEETYSSTDKPINLAEMAKIWNDTKFFGYFENDYITALCEFCRCLEPYDSFPQLYYEYEGFDEMVCLEFHPGTETIMVSTFCFTDELKKENLPPHPEEVKENVTAEEYREYNQHEEDARKRVFSRIISMDSWKRSKLVPSNLTDEQKIAALYLQLLGNR